MLPWAGHLLGKFYSPHMRQVRPDSILDTFHFFLDRIIIIMVKTNSSLFYLILLTCESKGNTTRWDSPGENITRLPAVSLMMVKFEIPFNHDSM